VNVDHLVKMANEIAAFYNAESGADAPKNIASHLQRFWEPRMRKAIVEYAASDGAGLVAAAREAVELLKKS
jgi:formate dehydrogenase subunit delta